jgi:alpha-galactosidase
VPIPHAKAVGIDSNAGGFSISTFRGLRKTMKICAVFDPDPQLTTDFSQAGWCQAPLLAIAREWNGEAAPAELRTTARVLWSPNELLFGFECAYTELDVDERFDVQEERHALWDRDVCEAFVRSPREPHVQSYREFEVAPTGQWCDLLVDRARMWSDWQWKSGMRTAAEIAPDARCWRVAMAVPFSAFGGAPAAGEIWHANLFRISRLRGERRYLALSPTFTAAPNYHVAACFVPLEFHS